MALELDERGLLPPGVHDASLEEVDQVFGRFQRTDRRLKLMAKLRDYLGEVKKAFPGAEVIIDGSFVMTSVDEPDDIDLVLVLPEDWDAKADLKPRQYNLVWQRWTRRTYEVEVQPAPAGSAKEKEWLDLFARVRDHWCELFGWPFGIKKGVVRVTP